MKLKQLIIEQKIYRGEGKESSNRYIEWYSVSEEQAYGYAKSRESGDIKTIDFDSENVVNFSHDTFKLTPNQFAQRALSQIKNKNLLNMEKLKDGKNNFNDFFGTLSRPVIDYWSDDISKQHTATFLKLFAFEAITILEDGIKTIGVLR
jgi:hypothetical protein